MTDFIDTTNQARKVMHLLVRQADLLKHLCNRAPQDLLPRRSLAAANAEQTVIAYANECVAQEVHKFARSGQPIFSDEFIKCFRAVRNILDQHVEPGIHTV